MLLCQLDQTFGALQFHSVNGFVIDQRFQDHDQYLAHTQEAADGPGGAGQLERGDHVLQGVLTVFSVPVKQRQRDMVAVEVGFKTHLFRDGLQSCQQRLRFAVQAQAHVRPSPVATVALMEMVGRRGGVDGRCDGQPALYGFPVPNRIPVGEHGGVGVGDPVQMIVAGGEHFLHLGDVVRAQALPAPGMGHLGQRCIALHVPALALGFQDFDALERTPLSIFQMVPFPHDLTADAEQEFQYRQVVEVVFLGVLETPFLDVVGLLQQAHRNADFRLLTQCPEHVLVGLVRPREVFGFLHAGEGFFQFALNKQSFPNDRGRRHPGGGQVAGFLVDGFAGEGQGTFSIPIIHGDLGTNGTELTMHRALGVFRHGCFQTGFRSRQPVFNFVKLVLALGHPGPEQCQRRILGNHILGQGVEATLQQDKLALGEKLAAVNGQYAGDTVRVVGGDGVAGGLFGVVQFQPGVTGPLVQLLAVFFGGAAQQVLEIDGKQRMVAEPQGGIVHGRDKQPHGQKATEQGLAIAVVHHPHDHPRVEAVQYAGA